MFPDSMISNEYLGENENKSNQTTASGSTLSVSVDDEYSTSSSNDSNRQHQLYPSLEVLLIIEKKERKRKTKFV
jgi:hypothetical protein